MHPRLPAALLVIATACSPTPDAMPHDVEKPAFHPGQVWTYQARPGEEASTLTVLKIDEHPALGTVVHISLDGLRIKSSVNHDGWVSHVRHLPVSKAALESSVLQRVGEGVPLPDFRDGYEQWSAAAAAGRGGIFTVSLAEAVSYLERTLN